MCDYEFSRTNKEINVEKKSIYMDLGELGQFCCGCCPFLDIDKQSATCLKFDQKLSKEKDSNGGGIFAICPRR